MNISPFYFTVLTILLAMAKPTEAGSVSWVDGIPPNGVDYCPPQNNQIYCKQFHIQYGDSTVLQGVSKLLADETWANYIYDRNFYYDLKCKLACIDFEVLKSMVGSVFDPFAASPIDNSGSMQNMCMNNMTSQVYHWPYILSQNVNGLTADPCKQLKTMLTTHQSECLSSCMDYNIHALLASVVTIGTTLLSLCAFYGIRKACSKKEDPRKILLDNPNPKAGEMHLAPPVLAFGGPKRRTAVRLTHRQRPTSAHPTTGNPAVASMNPPLRIILQDELNQHQQGGPNQFSQGDPNQQNMDEVSPPQAVLSLESKKFADKPSPVESPLSFSRGM